MLVDMNTKQVYNVYDDKVRKALEESYFDRKKVFESMYGAYTAAIGLEEFYKRQGEIGNIKG